MARAKNLADPQTARAAVEALAVLTTNLVASGRSFDDAAGVTAAVVAASQSDDAQLRSASAFTLGVLGGPGAVERLGQLAGDVADDVRFNAALALARQGREESYLSLIHI